MIKEKKSNRGIINIVLIIGFLIFCAGLYQIGTVSFLSINMKDIENDWVPAMDNESRGYYMSYYENDTLNIISQIYYRETIDYVINNPYELFEINMTDIFQDLKMMGYKYLYWFNDAYEEIVVSKSFYEYENNVDSYKIKLHDWFLGDSNYWIWTLESKGDSPTTIVNSIPLLLIGLAMIIFGGVAKSINKRARFFDVKKKIGEWREEGYQVDELEEMIKHKK